MFMSKHLWANCGYSNQCFKNISPSLLASFLFYDEDIIFTQKITQSSAMYIDKIGRESAKFAS